MIACASPGFSSANHTINTLRYSDRLKEKTHNNNINNINNNNNNNNNNYNINIQIQHPKHNAINNVINPNNFK